jgi:hypothetical protein
MTVERRNPLPRGWYWYDVPTERESTFLDWRAANRGSVLVRKTTTDDAVEPPTTWFLFEVVSPVQWNLQGFPEIAKGGANTELDDVIPDSHTKEPTSLDKLFKAVFWVGVGIMGIVAVREATALIGVIKGKS